MQDGEFHVLFLSQRDPTRSVIAQAILNKIGNGRFKAFSAATHPAAGIEPEVQEVLQNAGVAVGKAKPEHFKDFLQANVVELDFVFTLSDTAVGEDLPEWPGPPVTSHWRCPDPVAAAGEEWERKQVFTQVMAGLERRLKSSSTCRSNRATA